MSSEEITEMVMNVFIQGGWQGPKSAKPMIYLHIRDIPKTCTKFTSKTRSLLIAITSFLSIINLSSHLHAFSVSPRNRAGRWLGKSKALYITKTPIWK